MIQPYTRLLAIAAMGALLAGCASEQPEDTTEPEVIEVDTSIESGTDSSTSTGVTDESGYQGAELDDPNSLLSDRFVYFEFNKSDVRSADRPVIEAHANYLQRNPGATLSLEGHADERGTREYNSALGERRAKELILSAGPWSAQEGYEWGLVNRVCEPDELLVDVTDVAQRICANAPISVRQAKKSIHYGLQVDNMTGLIYEVQCYERMIATDDRREGIRSFNEKRKPKFEGR